MKYFMKNLISLCVMLILVMSIMACQTTNRYTDAISKEETHDTTPSTEETTVEKDITSEPVSVELDTDIATEEISRGDDVPGVEIIFDSLYCPTMNVLEINNSYDNANFGKHSSDIILNGTKEKMETLINTQAVCNLSDLIFSGDYMQSFNSPYYRGSYHTYSGIEDGNQILFSINQDTGKIMTFKYPDGYTEKNFDRPILTEQQNLSLAEKYLSSCFGESAKDFKLDSCQYRSVPAYANGVYVYGFVRMMDNLKTDEAVVIKITDRGVMTYFYAFQPGSMDDVEVPNYNESDIIAAIENKLANIYVNQMKTSRVFYEVEDVWLTRLNDGKLYLRYNIKVNVSTVKNGYFMTDYAELLVCVS